jgi:hypothetical protein
MIECLLNAVTSKQKTFVLVSSKLAIQRDVATLQDQMEQAYRLKDVRDTGVVFGSSHVDEMMHHHAIMAGLSIGWSSSVGARWRQGA